MPALFSAAPSWRRQFDRHRTTLAVNLGGVVEVTYVFLPDLPTRPESHELHQHASAVITLPYATTYAATKWPFWAARAA